MVKHILSCIHPYGFTAVHGDDHLNFVGIADHTPLIVVEPNGTQVVLNPEKALLHASEALTAHPLPCPSEDLLHTVLGCGAGRTLRKIERVPALYCDQRLARLLLAGTGKEISQNLSLIHI